MKTLFFEVTDDGNKIEDYNEMKALLEKHGIIIDWDTDKNTLAIYVFEEALSRGAGRKKMLHAVKDPTNTISGIRLTTLGDVLKMQETMTEDEIVSYLNMSRATYYRHLKKAKERKEKEPDSDPTF